MMKGSRWIIMKRFSVVFLLIITLFISVVSAAALANAQPANPVQINPTQTSPAPVDPAPARVTIPYDDNTDTFFKRAMNRAMVMIAGLFAWLVGTAAVTLDYSIYYTVINMGEYVRNLTAIGIVWQVMRDIGNIIIIFGFLAIGIATILQANWYGGGLKMLPMLLVAAVFLNFSLFIAKAVIDTGNLFATQIYTQIRGGSLPTERQLREMTVLSAIKEDGISSKMMSQLGLATIYGNVREDGRLLGRDIPWYVGFMSIILFIITAFVMFSLAFILIARFVILLFLIMVSPIGFAGLAIPKLKDIANRWWSELFKQTFIAPVLLLLLYIALSVITSTAFLTGFRAGTSPDWTGFARDNMPGFGAVLISFLVAMGLLLAVVIFAKQMSAFGAGLATKAAGALTFGLIARGARLSAGRFSQYASQRVRSSGNRFIGEHTKAGRLLATGFDKGAKGSFDVRGIKVGGGLDALSVDAGKAKEGGYRKQQEEAIKRHKEYAKSVGQAIQDRGMTPEEKEAKEKAENELKAAETKKQEAKNKQDTEGKIIIEQTAEVARLEEKQASFANKILPDPMIEGQIEAAKKSLEASKINLEAAKLEEQTADDKIENAKKDSKNADARIEIRVMEAKKKYADNIATGPAFSFGSMIYGSSRNKAAEEIIKEAKTNKDKEFLKKLQNAMEKNEDEDSAPTPPQAPATPETSKP